MTDEITLTFPRGAEFHPVPHLVLSGLAARLALTVESLEDLQLALDALLDRSEPRGELGDLTVRMSVHDHELSTVVGPLASHVLNELERDPGDGLDLRRVLESTVDDVHVDGDSVRLTKKVAVG
jgi:hypothetical protein